jgi:hypothetical protein
VSYPPAVARFPSELRASLSIVEKLESVRADRTLSRSGLWATGPRQLALPFEARGLSEVLIASGSLRLTPDYDLLAWLCERWAQRPTPSGIMRPTLYEVGSDLYKGPPSGENYRDLVAAGDRLAFVTVRVAGVDALTGEPGDYETIGHLLDFARPDKGRSNGVRRLSVELSGWLRRAIDSGAPVRIPWRTLRLFGRNQQLAKRLWIYLAAERWKRCGDGRCEGCWIACGDRLEASLGMDYDRARAARAALKRACEAIRRTDARYAAGSLGVVKFGRSWRIQAERPTWEEWRELRPEHEQARRAISAALLD